MKTLVRSVLLAGGLGILVGVAPASAQVFQEVTFTTTFPFTVGQKTLPAGSYTVRPAYQGDGSLLEIRGDRTSAMFFGENAGAPRSDPKDSAVIFDKAGDHYVLAEIWDGPDREGADLIPAKAARPDKAEGHHASK